MAGSLIVIALIAVLNPVLGSYGSSADNLLHELMRRYDNEPLSSNDDFELFNQKAEPKPDLINRVAKDLSGRFQTRMDDLLLNSVNIFSSFLFFITGLTNNPDWILEF